MPNILRTLDSSIKYLEKNSISLEILIANIGHHATLLDCVCKSKNIPSYLIINGLLGPEYQDDSKYATFINSYSESIKKYYFREMNNIVVLGDPRMDMYTPSDIRSSINTEVPTVTIGASGFNSVDLNSYVAVEFDFMYDVLSAFSKIIHNSQTINLIIKVRGNGYKKQYEDFVKKFFPSLSIEIIDSTPMKKVLERTDLYISIYSQTLNEKGLAVSQDSLNFYNAWYLNVPAAILHEKKGYLYAQRNKPEKAITSFKKALKNIEGVISAEVSYKTKLAIVTFDDEKTGVATLVEATVNAGYPSKLASNDANE